MLENVRGKYEGRFLRTYYTVDELTHNWSETLQNYLLTNYKGADGEEHLSIDNDPCHIKVTTVSQTSSL